MSGPGSLGVWVIIGIVVPLGVALILWGERARRRGFHQRRGAEPHGPPRIIASEIGPDGDFNRSVRAYPVTSDPKAFADIFVPSDRKD